MRRELNLSILCLLGVVALALPRAGAAQMDRGLAGAMGPVRIGLLVSRDMSGSEGVQSIVQAARMAVLEANNGGGYRGRPFELVVRSIDGRWTSGADEVVRLAFEDDVLGIVGALDGQGAHLAEQVVTKRRVVFLSASATDPTLAQINIPWFFNVVPDDRRQAEVLAREIVERKGLRSVATLRADTYDARLAEESFVRAIESAGGRADARLRIGDALKVDGARQIDAFALFAPPEGAAGALSVLRRRGIDQPIFAPLSLNDPRFTDAIGSSEANVFLVGPDEWNARAQSFRRAYEDAFGAPARLAEAYVYDAVSALVTAIRRAGLDRSLIREALISLEDRQGVTGPVRFDAKGNRVSAVTVGGARFLHTANP